MNYYKTFLATAYITTLLLLTGCSSPYSQTERQLPTEKQHQTERQSLIEESNLEKITTPGRDITKEANRILKRIKKEILYPEN